MAASIEQQILVRIKTVVEGLDQIKSLSTGIKGLNGGRGGASSLTNDFVKAGIAAGGVNSVLTKGIDLLEQLGSAGAGAFGSFVAEGVKFNATIESAKIGIATIVANTYDVRNAQGQLLDPAKAFNASLQEAEHLERELQKSAIETKFEFQDILGFFNSTVLASAGLKTNLEGLVRLTQDFSLAAGAANIDIEKVNTGIKQILTGNTTVRNDLARVVFPGLNTKQINETLKAQREAGTLVEFLTKKLEIFRLSSDVVGQSFEAVASNAKDAFKVFEAAATLPLFDKIKQALGLIINQVVDLSGDAVKLTPTFQKIADTLGVILGFAGNELLNAIIAFFGYLSQIADYLDRNKEDIEGIVINVFTIAEQVAGIAGDLLSIVGDVAEANDSTKNWLTVTQSIALFLGFIRDIIGIISGLCEALAGLVLQSIMSILGYINEILITIIDNTGGWLRSLGPVAVAIDRIAQSIGAAGAQMQQFGTDRLISGLNFDNLNNAANGTNRTIPRAITRTPTPFSFSPKNINGGGDDKKKRGEQQRLKDAQKLFDAIEKYQIANTRREVQLFEEANKQILGQWERRYQQGLVSAEDFYKQKQALEEADLNKQKDALLQEQKFAETALARDLGAIVGKFNLSEDQVQATVDHLQQVVESGKLATTDDKTIKQAIEYQKYLEQTAQITQKLREIEIKRAASQVDTTNATADATRENKRLFDGLNSELASSKGNDGLKELYDLQKRVSDEFPKILSATNKTSPALTQLVDHLHEASEVDISSLPKLLDEVGIKFGDLSDESRLFIRLLERLQSLAKIKTIESGVTQAQDTFKTSTDRTRDDFDKNRLTLDQAQAQLDAAKVPLVTALNSAYQQQLSIVTALQAVGLVTQKDLDDLENLKRAVQGVTDAITAEKLALISTQESRTDNTFQSNTQQVDLARKAGDISAKEARKEILALQQQEIAALNDELQALLRLDQTNTDVIAKVAETRNKIKGLENDTNADSINLATSLNGTIGSAFSSFVTDITSGTQSIGDAFRNMLASLLSGIANAIAQALLLKYVLRPLGLAGGGDESSGGIGGFLAGLFGGGHAEGGILSGPGTGVSDSFLIAASHGEGVIPARRVRQYGSDLINSIIQGTFMPQFSFAGGFADGGFPGGSFSGGRKGTRIVNSVDPNLVRDFMQSADGEEIIINVIGKNPGLVQRLV